MKCSFGVAFALASYVSAKARTRKKAKLSPEQWEEARRQLLTASDNSKSIRSSDRRSNKACHLDIYIRLMKTGGEKTKTSKVPKRHTLWLPKKCPNDYSDVYTKQTRTCFWPLWCQLSYSRLQSRPLPFIRPCPPRAMDNWKNQVRSLRYIRNKLNEKCA